MKSLIHALDRHAGAIQALGAILTVLLALGALLGVKLQIDASEQMQKDQSARDIYREYLNISIGRPEFASPDYCSIVGTARVAAYENYVEYLLYTAEQAISSGADWEPVFQSELQAHADYVCSVKDWTGYSDNVRQLIVSFKSGNCSKPRSCESIDHHS